MIGSKVTATLLKKVDLALCIFFKLLSRQLVGGGASGHKIDYVRTF